MSLRTKKKIIIIGGVAGGATAAARLRRLDENAEIIMFERGKHVSFANCGLPYFIGNEIEEKESLLVQTPEGIKKRFNIDVRINTEVLKIYPKNRQVVALDLKTGQKYKESYSKLILSPGATPLKPNIPGIDHFRVFSLRNIPDAENIKKYLPDISDQLPVTDLTGDNALMIALAAYFTGTKKPWTKIRADANRRLN